jgi:hypothetical protein
LEAATSTQIQRWCEKILSASTPEEALGKRIPAASRPKPSAALKPKRAV